jgi:hypothetical protein
MSQPIPRPSRPGSVLSWSGTAYEWVSPSTPGLVLTSDSDRTVVWTVPSGGGGGGSVSSVFGRTGAVTALSSDYSAHYQPLNSNLTAYAGLASTGLVVRTGAGTATVRSITGTASEISVTDGSGVSGAPTIGLASNPTIPGTGGAVLPIGTTAQRGASTAGRLRASTTLGVLEYYSGTGWEQVASESYVTTVSSALIAGARRLALFGGF